jgi:hypothetical protein
MRYPAICPTAYIPPHPVNNQTTCIRSSSAINPRGNIRQRGDRLLVTCNHVVPFLQLLVLAGTLRAQLWRFTCCYFYLPSKPCLRPFPLPGPPLLYPASVFTISDFTKLCASGREHGGQRKALRPSSSGPDWHCGTSLARPSAQLGEATATSQRPADMYSSPPDCLKDQDKRTNF